ncbi:hypothetical protein M406DRAFT_333924 [Cryphonectria parasitica EP155]|uniref:NTF2-like domain-containing protein n=1 Tax=Cryphonectria parasitica (strain ATCC 38755 / EP155) TaxID=660469 RepID=A0A9P4XVS7_CRYP1|nr:uncharacterized protein M406DRAFT_333924 [Cryphonectria parasitica EP155]KAF3761879.1 hypothetical protein M406DRAFT_333924 [Cryphonectria parasitica EP155]
MLLRALAVSAAPRGGPGGWGGPHGPCLNSTGVDVLVEGYTYLLEYPGGPDFNSTAEAILSDEFVVESDSILTLSGRPLGQPAYPSKEVYIATQFQTPPLPVVQTLDVFATCDRISWRWNASGIGSNQYEIKGIIVLDVDVEEVQITAVYSEFNTAAFETDLGSAQC